MKFKNKNEFIEFIENKMNVKLEILPDFNKKRNVLYTEIPGLKMNDVFENSLISYIKNKLGMRIESHRAGFCWIWIK